MVPYPASVFLGDPQPWAAVHISHKEVRNSKGCIYMCVYVRVHLKEKQKISVVKTAIYPVTKQHRRIAFTLQQQQNTNLPFKNRTEIMIA